MSWRNLKKIEEEVLQEARKEINFLMTRVFQDKEKRGGLDLEATELSIRHLMHQVGGVFLEKLINADKRRSSGIPDSLWLGARGFSSRIIG